MPFWEIVKKTLLQLVRYSRALFILVTFPFRMPFWEVAKKDLLLLRRDLRALFILVAFPLLFITIIGLTTGKLLGWKSGNQVLKIGVIDRVEYKDISDTDDRRIARNMTWKILNGLRSGKGRRVTLLESDVDPDAALDEDDYDAILEIGPNFFVKVGKLKPEQVADLKGLTSLDMQLHTKVAGNSGTRSIIEELLLDHTVKAVFQKVLCDKLSTGDFAANRIISQRLHCERLRTESVELLPETPDDDAESGGDANVYQVLIPSYTVMFVFFLVNIMARSFLQERDLGTLRRLRMAPISAAGLVAGKTIPFLVISLVQTGLLFVAGKLLFRMTWGPVPWMIIPVIFATSLSAVGLGQ
ncbi:MAG: ABC transporter permease, partial [Planctomycetaceae bacterium]